MLEQIINTMTEKIIAVGLLETFLYGFSPYKYEHKYNTC